MSLFGKLKNMFYEDEEFEEQKTLEQKTVEQKKPVEETVSESELLNTDPTFKFPVIFEEEDFKEVEERQKPIFEKPKQIIKETLKKETLKQPVFKPTPIISPIYGILDKNYKKDEVKNKDGLLSSVYETEVEIDVDTVRKKAYGEVTREKKFNTEKEINLFEKQSVEVEEEYDLDELDKKIKSIDELLKETKADDFYSLVDNMYKDEGDDQK